MSSIKVMNKGEKYAHASVGSLKGFEGKEFAKEATEATSCEISFGTLPTGASVPFFHSHKANEENSSQVQESFRSTMKSLTSPKAPSFV